MKTRPKVRGPPLSSMIRVDVVNRMDVGHDEVSGALGEDPGCVDAARFEETRPTRYGRIHEDDRTIMFAKPEDAAGQLGFDLAAGSR